MIIRHLNRGDVKEGGCALCKPRHKRYKNQWSTRGEYELPPGFLIREGLEEFEAEAESSLDTG